MNKFFNVTAQMIVKNEERFIWFSIKSILPYVKKFLITDTGSTDNTLSLIKGIKDKKIKLSQNKKDNIVKIRQQQLEKTKTPWFLLLDGDEIWPHKELLQLLQLTKVLSENKIAVVNKTRNCVGDIWHFLSEETGEYCFFGKKGHLNIRLMRNLPYEIVGRYPWEEYTLNGKSINEMRNRLFFSETWYLHATHLRRSSKENKIEGRRRKIIEKGILIKSEELPEVLFDKEKPEMILNPLAKRNLNYEIKAKFLTPIKNLKRMIIR